MQADEVKALLEKAIADSQVMVEGEGCDFRLTIISDQFEAMRPVQRQQMIYAHLNPFITSGAIHAVTMVALTTAERARQLDNQD
ncbi:BolA family protein [Endozoicomonas sp.]|uniref:BolA family protein n=1 Tax=Endozoicomonas sp. TaxID=1892382 RepID=UPI00288422B5|nr:BolA/IbaG family iron-sulfur metabolism protein [Endozoicomonas sp.]